MRFFTPAWCTEDLTDEEASAVPARYALHLDGLPRMPAPVYALARGINIHDGLIRRFRVERVTNTVIALLRCGDKQVGYFDLELGYIEVQFDRSELQGLEAVARNPESEALYDEIDYDPEGHWIHRILFWPYREVSITFRTLRIVVVPAASREFDRPLSRMRRLEAAPPNQPAAADAGRHLRKRMSQTTSSNGTGIQGWRHFLSMKESILAQYDLARSRAAACPQMSSSGDLTRSSGVG